jgi:hypothetical protein
MIRTVWLTLICSSGLGVLGAIKIAATPFASADPSHVESTAGEQDTLAKADRLEVHHMPAQTVVTPVAIVLPKTAPQPAEPMKIVSRHWHDPLAPKAAPIKPSKPPGTHR